MRLKKSVKVTIAAALLMTIVGQQIIIHEKDQDIKQLQTDYTLLDFKYKDLDESRINTVRNLEAAESMVSKLQQELSFYK